MKVRIAARRSDLARLQAYQVGAALRKHHRGLEIEFLFKESLGDKNQSDALWKMPERGVFTEDFVDDLRNGRTDLVVHSWKDLPTEKREGLVVAATLPRADARDLLLLRKDAFGVANLTLLTSSPRRAFATGASLAPLLPFPVKSIETKPVRGNVATRLKKLALGEGHGLFLAKAALDHLLGADVPNEDFSESRSELRSLLENFRWMVLPLSLFPTAPAQGALAIEICSDRDDLRKLLAPLHDFDTATCVEQERLRFAKFGGGCHQKIGISVVKHPRLGRVEFFHGHPDGAEPSRKISFDPAPLPKPPGMQIWPENARPVFQRQRIKGLKNPGGALFVSRVDALPDKWVVNPEQLVWCAGVRTWQKLARRGIWVHGTSDGLGETIPELKALLGREVAWTKLTHSDSENDRVFPCLATYRLEPLSVSPPPLVHSYFWPSESLFRWAVGKRPEIREADHAAGPGYTAEAIEKELGRSIDVYYNYAHWRTGNAADET
ncbi:MAG: hydroxymethylbilane synthase [Bdellovibrionota bacterium]